MVELRCEPYTLKTRPDIQESERELREQLDVTWSNGCFFNVLAHKNSQILAEYDAVLWNSDSILFIEYKDSLAAYRRMYAKRAQQVSDIARNISRRLGFQQYSYIIVVKGLEKETIKGGVPVIPLDRLKTYQGDFKTTKKELEYLDKLLYKYQKNAEQCSVDDKLMRDLQNLRDMIEQAG
jgi:hypothetical protein